MASIEGSEDSKLEELLTSWGWGLTELLPRFVAGGAGVGKSTLINAIKQVLERYWMHQPNNSPEDSMNNVLQEIYENHQPFGGISVITVGDFNQLPPPAGIYVFKTPPDDFSRLLGPHLWQHFKIFELTEIMRQRDDITFANALNNLALGKTTPQQDEMFSNRQLDVLGINITTIINDVITLYYKNADVDAFNNLFIATSKNETVESPALDSCSGTGSSSARNYMLARAQTLQHKQTQNLQYLLKLCTETKYIVCQNVAVPDGISNGTPCILKKVIFGELQVKGVPTTSKIPLRVYVQFQTEHVGHKRREKLKNVIKKDGLLESGWTPLERVTRNQLPILPANAQTIHCSQSCTYQKIAVFVDGLTPFSRVTSLSGLYIAGTYKRPPEATLENDPSLKEMTRMREESVLQLTLTFPEHMKNSNNTLVIFHNVRSLHLHFANIANDKSFLACDIIMLAETWSLPTDQYDIANFTIVFRTDSNNTKRKAFGTIIYVKNNLLPFATILFQTELITQAKHQSTVVALKLNHTGIIMVYKSPKTAWNILKQQLTTALDICYKNNITDICLMGDFNIRYQTSEPNYISLCNFMKNKNIFMLLDETKVSTDHNSLIDLCFSSNNLLRADIFESVISDHKPIWLELLH
ncbi:hypothetical protein FOCC_FOCC006196 [Frankliniella occidentalis]|nr:hypothetical protein FOCC_FOCC006196 [Frankliniella occidentalis]